METKLDLALRSLSANPDNFRKDVLNKSKAIGAGAGFVWGATGSALYPLAKGVISPTGSSLSPIEIAGMVANPFVKAAVVGTLERMRSARKLKKAQILLNKVGGADNLTDEQVNKLIRKINENNGVVSNSESFQHYIPEEEHDKFKNQMDEVKLKYPIDKGSRDYKQNMNSRIKEFQKINTQQARALLKYSELSNTKKGIRK